ncbi:flavin monoamine oxidase family protein [Nesterenkonia aerolata]|uniref:NAD(P)/FAD-dependent oxidoreductase n=1 Tax=Nesterenkonia aerolata TaxID=3074079 RepID=A0ABU2DU13_9MICC|nr:NAD(P)/FAD-dependent oxidoreductase [Nesterenkonia sp. LY-0111]MDR8019983.1 NAD(P)/FAD-dependent oxidoreductase [Nesterenkonia sp. LY-0111]
MSDGAHARPLTAFGPDFPFPYDEWLNHPAGLGAVPEGRRGEEVAVIGAGIAGIVAAYELMRLGLRPVIYEASRLGGRLRSEPFGYDTDTIAELGGMRFPRSSAAFFHYVDMLGLQTAPFPNPLTEAAGSTVIELGGESWYARSIEDLPPLFREIAEAWDGALESVLHLGELQDAMRRRDPQAVKRIWDHLVPRWDDHSFYEFIASSPEFSRLSFRHREVFGQVGFGTGGWDSDFPNSMLEILRVAACEFDDDQHLIRGGVEQLPRGLWEREVDDAVHWPSGTSLASLHGGAPYGGVDRVSRAADGKLAVVDSASTTRHYRTVLATCQSWLLTTQVQVEEELFSQDLWMALDRTRYMQSSKTFVKVDRPFWRDVDQATGRETMSMTLTNRLTRGTYFFEDGPDDPAVICLSYSWMSDALKMLPHTSRRRADLALEALEKIYPDVDVRSHIIGDPVTVSWESDPYFLGAFKGALPGHYRYNERMYRHFMQAGLPEAEKGIFLAGDDVSFTPAWAEGAVQTALNAVWGIVDHLGGASDPKNPGPGDRYAELGPIELSP